MKCIENKDGMGNNWSFEQHQKLVYILQQCKDCKNIVDLKDWCMTKSRTYQIVEQSDIDKGRDLFDIVLKKVDMKRFTEFDAIQIVKNMVNGLKWLHGMQYVHGNITPDNIRYYGDEIKIDNFKSVGDCCNDDGLLDEIPYKCHILFAAPEIIELGKKRKNNKHSLDVIDFTEDIWLQITEDNGYNMSADIWSLGVILYTILCGYPPFIGCDDVFITNFKTESKYEIHDKIKDELQSKDGLRFHEGTNWDFVSKDAKDLLRKLLVWNKRERMNVETIVKHPWIVNNARNREKTKMNKNGFGREYKRLLTTWQEIRNSYHYKLSVIN